MAEHPAAAHHRKAAEHHQLAAKEHQAAAEAHSRGEDEKGGLHANLAYGHSVQAAHEMEEAAKKYTVQPTASKR